MTGCYLSSSIDLVSFYPARLPVRVLTKQINLVRSFIIVSLIVSSIISLLLSSNPRVDCSDEIKQ